MSVIQPFSYAQYLDPPFIERRPGEESDGENYQDTSSDASSESESEKLIAERRESLRNTGCADQEGFSSDDSEACNQSQVPIFEYQEYDPPYGRQPLADKVSFSGFFFLLIKIASAFWGFFFNYEAISWVNL